MKSILLVLPFLLISFAARADIPAPAIDQLSVIGDEAAALAAKLPGEYRVIREDARHVVKQKSLQTPKELTEISCTKVELPNGALKSEECVVRKSANGVSLHFGKDAAEAPKEE